MCWVNLSALWNIVVSGLIAGAGLPALFAAGLVAAAICFLVVLAAGG